jgi:hypothetical protein
MGCACAWLPFAIESKANPLQALDAVRCRRSTLSKQSQRASVERWPRPFVKSALIKHAPPRSGAPIVRPRKCAALVFCEYSEFAAGAVNILRRPIPIVASPQPACCSLDLACDPVVGPCSRDLADETGVLPQIDAQCLFDRSSCLYVNSRT